MVALPVFIRDGPVGDRGAAPRTEPKRLGEPARRARLEVIVEEARAGVVQGSLVVGSRGQDEQDDRRHEEERAREHRRPEQAEPRTAAIDRQPRASGARDPDEGVGVHHQQQDPPTTTGIRTMGDDIGVPSSRAMIAMTPQMSTTIER